MRFIGWAEVSVPQWLTQWSALYPDDYDEEEYKDLIGMAGVLSAADYERIGKWKDNAKSESRWRANVASVPYEIWMQAARELPRCPNEDSLAEFLWEWSERTYQDEYASGNKRIKGFGLSRASTLLHFISRGRHPIFDSRVVTAMSQLLRASVEYSIQYYMGFYGRAFQQIADLCGTRDLRALDKALFSYGTSIGSLNADNNRRFASVDPFVGSR